MTTKNTTTPTGFEMWEGYTKSYTDLLLETTQKTFDQSLALSERMAGMWLDTAKKAQELAQSTALKETEAAFQMAEAAQTQMKTASDRFAKMVKEYSVN